jgi:hypothetical protein
MRKNNMVLWILPTLLLLFGIVNTTGGEKQSQEAKQEEIDRYIARMYQEIDDFYAVTLADLKLRADSQIRALEVADKGVFASLSQQAQLAKSVLLFNKYECEESRLFDDRDLRFRDTFRQSPKRFAFLQGRIAEEKSRILNNYESRKLQLEKNKRYAKYIGVVKLQKQLKEHQDTERPPLAQGVVTGIVHSEDRPSAIIDGRIVYERDTILRVRVVKIHRNKVDFVKGGQQWSQEVRQTPSSYWRE